jgi:hypothetical protein
MSRIDRDSKKNTKIELDKTSLLYFRVEKPWDHPFLYYLVGIFEIF